MALLTVLQVVLVAATVVIGAVALSDVRAQGRALHERQVARALLARVQADTDAAQASLSQSVQADVGARMGLLGSAVAHQQSAIEDWGSFSFAAMRWHGSGSRGPEIDTMLGQLAAVTGSSLASGDATAGLGAAKLAVSKTLAADVGTALAPIATADDAWWTKTIQQLNTRSSQFAVALELLGAAALACLLGSNGYAMVASQRRERRLVAREADLDNAAATNEFEARLQRALDMSVTEDRVYGVVEQALEETAPELGVEVIVSDSSRAHFQRMVRTGTGDGGHCGVEGPRHCPAAQRGEVLVFGSNQALDACPYLKEQADPCSSVCIPVSVGGRTNGVLRATGPVGQPPDQRRRVLLELIARRASDRIGTMRAFNKSEVQASTDPLTGLSNRRALENSVRRLSVAATPYAVAFGDLDHFKKLNDVHGHGAGDQALRTFARVLRESIRPDDLAGRFGGEEFVLALPNCGVDEAVEVLERVREHLATTLAQAGGPTFTVSFGLATGGVGQSFEDLVSAADTALLDAKANGRNRVVVAGGRPSAPPLAVLR